MYLTVSFEHFKVVTMVTIAQWTKLALIIMLSVKAGSVHAQMVTPIVDSTNV